MKTALENITHWKSSQSKDLELLKITPKDMGEKSFKILISTFEDSENIDILEACLRIMRELVDGNFYFL